MSKRVSSKLMIGKKVGSLTILSVSRFKNKTYYKCKCDCGNVKMIRSDYIIGFGVKHDKHVTCGECYKRTMIGKRFGQLTVTKYAGSNGKKLMFECKCDCGNKTIVDGDLLRCGIIKTCGKCYVTKMIGKRFGKLTVIKQVPTVKKGVNARFLCKCDCGGTRVVDGAKLNGGVIDNCGFCKYYAMIGKTYNKLTVIDVEQADRSKSTIGDLSKVICKCSCGNPEFVKVYPYDLSNGVIKSCGECNKFEMIGKKFHHLTVIKYVDTVDKQRMFKTKCDCGEERILSTADIGHVKSCGKCYHGFPKSSNPVIYKNCIKLAKIYDGILKRCTNPNDSNFYNYGGRGIKCLFSRMEFIKKYYLNLNISTSDDIEIDRINNDGHYSFDNVRWVSHTVNRANRIYDYDLTYDSVAKRLLSYRSFIALKINGEPSNVNDYYRVLFPLKTRTGGDLELFIHWSLKDDIYKYINNIIKNFRDHGSIINYTSISKVRNIKTDCNNACDFSYNVDSLDLEVIWL